MKELDYGKGYQYAHDEADAVADMVCLPPALEGRKYYEPTDRGLEAKSGRSSKNSAASAQRRERLRRSESAYLTLRSISARSGRMNEKR